MLIMVLVLMLELVVVLFAFDTGHPGGTSLGREINWRPSALNGCHDDLAPGRADVTVPGPGPLSRY